MWINIWQHPSAYSEVKAVRHGNNASISALEMRLVICQHESLVLDMRIRVLAWKFKGASTSEKRWMSQGVLHANSQ